MPVSSLQDIYWRQCSSENTEHMLPRACQCVPKQAADAAGTCVRKMKKKKDCLCHPDATHKEIVFPLSVSLSLPPSHSTAPDNTVQAEEGEQAVLDCLQPWHHLLIGRPEYHFSWAPGDPGTKTVFLTLLDLYDTNTNRSTGPRTLTPLSEPHIHSDVF